MMKNGLDAEEDDEEDSEGGYNSNERTDATFARRTLTEKPKQARPHTPFRLEASRVLVYLGTFVSIEVVEH